MKEKKERNVNESGNSIKNEKIVKKEKWVEADKINLKTLMLSLKYGSIVGIVINSIFILAIIVLATLTMLSITTKQKEELINDDYVISYISEVNNDTYESIKKEIIPDCGKGELVAFYVVIPSLMVLGVLIIMLVFYIKCLYFVDKVKTNKSLFTKEKLSELIDLTGCLQLAGFIFLLITESGLFYIIGYLFFVIFLILLVYLFNYCVKAQNE